MVMLVTALGSVTVMVAVPRTVLFTEEVARMVAVPAFLAVTTPLLLTEATAELVLVHLTFSDAPSGLTESDRVSLSPTSRESDLGERVILVGATAAATVICILFLILVLAAEVARINTFPGFLAVTVPSADTEAMAGLLLFQVTDWLAVAGFTVASRDRVSPTSS